MFIHRGLIEKNFRENHITSFKECIKKKFNIETDIHFTQNNTPICFHDYSLRRLFNIRKKTRTILDKNLKKYKITKLCDLLKILTVNTKVLVEIKPLLRKNTLNRLLETCNGFKKNVYFISFKESNLVKIRGITKDFKLGLILHSHRKNGKINQKLNKNHINFFVFHTQFLFISKIKKIQKKKYFYTFKNIRMNDAKSNYIIENIIK